MSLSFLTPTAALVTLAALLPLSAAVRGGASTARVRAALGLPSPARPALFPYLALAAIVVCLGLAAGQPVLTRTSTVQVRSDAQVLFVLDVSQSMAASARPGSPTRLERARDVAERLRASIPDVESGVATLTDRVLPDLLPAPDAPSFAATLTQSVRIEEPPPLASAVRATDFGALDDIIAGNYFAPAATKRVVVLVTDGESRPFDEGGVARALARGDVSFAAIRVGDDGESIFDSAGKADGAYVPDPTSRSILASLAEATGGSVFDEGEVDGASSFLHDRLGGGPTHATGAHQKDQILLAPLLAALALIPLALLLVLREGAAVTFVRAARRLV